MTAISISCVPGTLYDGSGQPHICIDEYMKRRLQIKLIHSIVSPIGD
ncbi:helix-turn-helix domain-containing protein [Coprococcus eutactus]